jgi:FkbM family methyltransferase
MPSSLAFLERPRRAIAQRISQYSYLVSTFSDFESIQNYRALWLASGPNTKCEQLSALPLRLRLLKSRTIHCRPSTSDVNVLDDVFRGRYHLPPPNIGSPRRILDLGSNIGLTIVHYAALYPESTILGVELDESNFALCRANIHYFESRCSVILGAVWHENGNEISYGGDRHWGFRVAAADGDAIGKVKSISIDALLDHMQWESVDFVKMDIEGAEREVFSRAGSWVERVRCLKVETHEPYSLHSCVYDLVRLGFETEPDRTHPRALIAYNRRVR